MGRSPSSWRFVKPGSWNGGAGRHRRARRNRPNGGAGPIARGLTACDSFCICIRHGIRRCETEGTRMSFEDQKHKTDSFAVHIMRNVLAMVWLSSSAQEDRQSGSAVGMAIGLDSKVRISDSYTVPRDVGSRAVQSTRPSCRAAQRLARRTRKVPCKLRMPVWWRL